MKLSQGELWESVLRFWKLDERERNSLEIVLRRSGGQGTTLVSADPGLWGWEDAKAYNLFQHHHLPSADAKQG